MSNLSCYVVTNIIIRNDNASSEKGMIIDLLTYNNMFEVLTTLFNILWFPPTFMSQK